MPVNYRHRNDVVDTPVHFVYFPLQLFIDQTGPPIIFQLQEEALQCCFIKIDMMTDRLRKMVIIQ